MFFFFKQKTAYEMRISDWSSDVCSSDLAQGVDRSRPGRGAARDPAQQQAAVPARHARSGLVARRALYAAGGGGDEERHRLSEKGGVQYAEEAYQGRTRALLSRRRPARDVDLAGHAIGRRRGPVSCWNEPVSGDLSVGNARRTAEAIVRNRSEEHTSELQSLMRISYAVF